MLACRTAILGALLNVRINLRGIRDDKFVSELSLKCDLLEKEAINSERELFEWAKMRFNNENIYYIGKKRSHH